jgi:hypothetical protein
MLSPRAYTRLSLAAFGIAVIDQLILVLSYGFLTSWCFCQFAGMPVYTGPSFLLGVPKLASLPLSWMGAPGFLDSWPPLLHVLVFACLNGILWWIALAALLISAATVVAWVLQMCRGGPGRARIV